MSYLAPQSLLAVKNLQCVRGDRILFSQLSFSVVSGQLLYIQGENGSGKTTLLRTLCGLSQAEAGEISWNNESIQTLAEDYTAKVLYIGHQAGIKEELTPVENCQFAATLSGLDVTREQAINALTQVNIARCADLPSRVLSQGQKRRVALARLWLHTNTLLMPVWILDEPFTALDANAITVLTSHIETFVNAGGIVLMTSHQAPMFNANIMQRLQLN